MGNPFEIIEDYRLSPEPFDKAQDIMNKRNSDAADKRTYPMNTESLPTQRQGILCWLRVTTCSNTNGRYTYENGVKLKAP